MLNIEITNQDISVITMALELTISDIQEDFKSIPHSQRSEHYKAISGLRETITAFSQRQQITTGQAKNALYSLRCLKEIIADDLSTNTDPKERDEALLIQKYANSAARKLNKAINYQNT